MWIEALLLGSVYLLNLPFGYWRQGTRTFTLQWILAIHIPVPLIFMIRILLEVPWIMIPIFVLAFFLGHYSGGRIRRGFLDRGIDVSRCLVMDILKNVIYR